MDLGWKRIKNIKGFKDLSALATANAGGNAISAVFWFYLASIMGPEQYGEVSYLIAIAGIAAVFCSFGGGQTLIVFTAKKLNLLWPAVLISIGSSIIVSIVLYILFKEPSLGVFAITYIIFNIAIADLLGRKMYKRYAKIFLIQKICVVAFALPLYYILGPTGIIFGFGFSMLIFSFQIVSSLKKSKLDFTDFRSKIGFAFNAYIESLARTLNGQIDKLIIAPMLGFTILGNYHLGIQVLSLLSILPTIAMQYMLPQDASGEGRQGLKKATIVCSIFLAIIGIISAPVLIPILFPDFIEAIIIVQIISLAVIPKTISIMYISKLLGNEKSKLVIIGSMIFLAIQIPLIYLLGNLFSVEGVVFALVISEISQAIYYFIVNKNLNNQQDIS
jgi:O-antigen/teichoic acid export membrane protein